MSPVVTLLGGLIDFYVLLILAYIVLSWFRPHGFMQDVFRTLGTIVEPFLGIFRRLIPPVGMVDFSPMVAIIVLELISRLLDRLRG